MSKLPNLKVEVSSNGYSYKLLESITIRGHMIPLGFRTDFASVPRILWSAFPPFGKYCHAAVLHDYLYCTRAHHSLTRKQVDQLFYDVMVASGVPVWKAKLMWSGVRLGGWTYWNSYK